MIRIIIIFFIFLTPVFLRGQTNDSIVKHLVKVMENSSIYSKEKEKYILSLKAMLQMSDVSETQLFHINEQISEQYRKYKVDSAIHYTLKNKELAIHLGSNLSEKVNLQLAKLYAVKGLYVESRKLLDAIEKNKLDTLLLQEYYIINNNFYSNYGLSTNDRTYFKLSEEYRDSLLMLLPEHSFLYQLETSTKNIAPLKNYELAQKQLLTLLEKTQDDDPNRAIIAYFLGLIYKRKGNIKLQEKYFSISAIADIKNSIKDNASLQSLALTYYELGDIDKAYLFIKAAIDDAVFCNVRYREQEGTSFYTIINTAYEEKEQRQKKQLRNYLLLISFLSIALIGMLWYVYKQMKHLIQVRRELRHTNIQLKELNSELSFINQSLQESNHIKEEYIAHFFNLCSSYIDKIENYRKLLYKRALNNQFQEVTKLLKSTTLVEKELEELYKNFDAIFLNIYPNFVEEFNNLLQPQEHIFPKKGELLNTELRIFALIRLGITDSSKIADFLRYSLRTVYNYRVKVRNKSAVSRDKFEEQVQKISVFNTKK